MNQFSAVCLWFSDETRNCGNSESNLKFGCSPASKILAVAIFRQIGFFGVLPGIIVAVVLVLYTRAVDQWKVGVVPQNVNVAVEETIEEISELGVAQVMNLEQRGVGSADHIYSREISYRVINRPRVVPVRLNGLSVVRSRAPRGEFRANVPRIPTERLITRYEKAPVYQLGGLAQAGTPGRSDQSITPEIAKWVAIVAVVSL